MKGLENEQAVSFRIRWKPIMKGLENEQAVSFRIRWKPIMKSLENGRIRSQIKPNSIPRNVRSSRCAVKNEGFESLPAESRMKVFCNILANIEIADLDHLIFELVQYCLVIMFLSRI